MQIKLVAFGIAKDILRSSETTLELEENISVGDLRTELTDAYPEFANLSTIRFAVNESYQSDQYKLHPDDEVVIIPPVSGG